MLGRKHAHHRPAPRSPFVHCDDLTGYGPTFFPSCLKCHERLSSLGFLVTQFDCALCTDDGRVNLVSLIQDEVTIVISDLRYPQVSFAPCSVVDEYNSVGDLHDGSRDDVAFLFGTAGKTSFQGASVRDIFFCVRHGLSTPGIVGPQHCHSEAGLYARAGPAIKPR